MLDLSNHFGIDVKSRFDAWFHGEFADEFKERWPKKGITLVLLDMDNLFLLHEHWQDPLTHLLYVDFLGDEESHKKTDGTLENVGGKLQYVLRTGNNSVEAQTDFAGLRPGDFPWQGAGEHRGFLGGVSGLAKEEDWEVFRRCVNKLIELLEAVGEAASKKSERLRNSDNPEPGVKYLNVTLTEDEVWPQAA